MLIRNDLNPYKVYTTNKVSWMYNENLHIAVYAILLVFAAWASTLGDKCG